MSHVSVIHRNIMYTSVGLIRADVSHVHINRAIMINEDVQTAIGRTVGPKHTLAILGH